MFFLLVRLCYCLGLWPCYGLIPSYPWSINVFSACRVVMEGELRTLSSSIRFMLCPYVLIINILRRALHLTPVLYRDAHLLIHVKNLIPAVCVSLRAMSLSTGSALAQSKAGTFTQLEPVFSEVRCNCPTVARTVERS